MIPAPLRAATEAFLTGTAVEITPIASIDGMRFTPGACCRTLMEAYEAEVVTRAAGDASRFDQVYQAYRSNPDVTRERIYIETVEEIFSNVEKIIIDEPTGGSGVVPYLPLRELNKSAGGN